MSYKGVKILISVLEENKIEEYTDYIENIRNKKN